MLQQLEHLLLDRLVFMGGDLQECRQRSLRLEDEVVDWVTAVDAAGG